MRGWHHGGRHTPGPRCHHPTRHYGPHSGGDVRVAPRTRAGSVHCTRVCTSVPVWPMADPPRAAAPGPRCPGQVTWSRQRGLSLGPEMGACRAGPSSPNLVGPLTAAAAAFTPLAGCTGEAFGRMSLGAQTRQGSTIQTAGRLRARGVSLGRG